MNKSILEMNRTVGERELQSGEPLPIKRQLEISLEVAAGYAVYNPEKGRASVSELSEQIRLVESITPEAQEIYFEQEADPRTDEQIALDEWQAETEATRMSDRPI